MQSKRESEQSEKTVPQVLIADEWKTNKVKKCLFWFVQQVAKCNISKHRVREKWKGEWSERRHWPSFGSVAVTPLGIQWRKQVVVMMDSINSSLRSSTISESQKGFAVSEWVMILWCSSLHSGSHKQVQVKLAGEHSTNWQKNPKPHKSFLLYHSLHSISLSLSLSRI